MTRALLTAAGLILTGCANNLYHPSGAPSDMSAYMANRQCGNQALRDYPLVMSADALFVPFGLVGGIAAGMADANVADAKARADAGRQNQMRACMASHGWAEN